MTHHTHILGIILGTPWDHSLSLEGEGHNFLIYHRSKVLIGQWHMTCWSLMFMKHFDWQNMIFWTPLIVALYVGTLTCQLQASNSRYYEPHMRQSSLLASEHTMAAIFWSCFSSTWSGVSGFAFFAASFVLSTVNCMALAAGFVLR